MCQSNQRNYSFSLCSDLRLYTNLVGFFFLDRIMEFLKKFSLFYYPKKRVVNNKICFKRNNFNMGSGWMAINAISTRNAEEILPEWQINNTSSLFVTEHIAYFYFHLNMSFLYAQKIRVLLVLRYDEFLRTLHQKSFYRSRYLLLY